MKAGAEEKRFLRALTAMLATFDRDLVSGQEAIWWDALRGFDLGLVERSMREHGGGGKFAPRPAEIVDRCREMAKAVARPDAVQRFWGPTDFRCAAGVADSSGLDAVEASYDRAMRDAVEAAMRGDARSAAGAVQDILDVAYAKAVREGCPDWRLRKSEA